ncbi:MAG: OmpA family protein [Spirochaetes bacterium]|nr:OmpA family protein [Spirochaetota bacterium]
MGKHQRSKEIIFIILFGMIYLTHVLMASDIEQIVIHNKFLELLVDEKEGHFILKSLRPYQGFMTYNEKVPSTSFATIQLNDRNYVVGTSKGNFIEKPEKITPSMVYYEWQIRDVTIKQFLVLTNNPYSPKEDTLKITFKVRNDGFEDQVIGFRFTLDTLLGENDAVPFFIPDFGYITGYEFLGQDKLPPYWYALQSLNKDDFKVQITLSDIIYQKPDEAIFANWEEFQKNLWDIPRIRKKTFKRNILSILDSAVAFYWFPKKLKEKGERTYSFFYGHFTGDKYIFEKMSALLSMPFQSRIQPFFVTLHLQNNSQFSLDHIAAAIDSVDNNDFIFTTEKRKEMKDIKSREMRNATWKIMPKEQASGKYKFKVDIMYRKGVKEIFTNTIEKEIQIINERTFPLLVENKYFSPNGDLRCDTTSIWIQDIFEKTKYLFIMDSEENLIKKVDLSSNTYIWDGFDQKENLVLDGMYYCYCSLVSNFQRGLDFFDIIVDTYYPTLKINFTNEYLARGELDDFTLQPLARDDQGIQNWSLSISDSMDHIYLATNGSDELKGDIKWNMGNLFKNTETAGQAYYIRFMARDRACNQSFLTQKFRIIDGKVFKKSFPDILFDFDSCLIKEDNYQNLANLISFIEKSPVTSIKLIGHTDSVGTERYNKTLSIRRAESVKDYLIKNAQKEISNIISVGKGESEPKVKNINEKGRSRNRRVEIFIKVGND